MIVEGAIELGSPGREWVKLSLSQGLPLSLAALEQLPLDSGVFYALATSTAIEVSLTDLRDGLGSEGTVSKDAGLSDVVAIVDALVGNRDDVLVVLEDTVGDVSWPGNGLHGDAWLGFDWGMAHVHTWPQLREPDRLGSYLAYTSGYPLNVFVTTGISKTDCVEALRRADYVSILSRTRLIVNAVFDFDGYGVWMSRPDADTIETR